SASWKSNACSTLLPTITGPSTGVNFASSNPAALSCASTTSGLAIEKGPGPQVWAFSPGGGRKSSTTFLGTPTQGFSSSLRQVTNISRPPGFSALRTLRIAATGLLKNIIPKREKQKSNSGSKRDVCTSAATKRTRSGEHTS